MEASILDLRYRMRDVVKALDKREKVRILYHGKIKGEIIPFKTAKVTKSTDHPLFGSLKDDKESPSALVAEMRRRRIDAL
jgi:hypothetical protein